MVVGRQVRPEQDLNRRPTAQEAREPERCTDLRRRKSPTSESGKGSRFPKRSSDQTRRRGRNEATQRSPKTVVRASSMPHCCSGLTRPTSSPSRPESIVPTCSTRTRVVSPSSSISGRNDAGLALWDVGATSITERGSSSLAWTITPYRRPRCSCPVPRGGRNSWTSPLSTHALHEICNLKHLAPILFVCLKRRDLSGKRRPVPEPSRAIEDRPTNCLGPAKTG
jgi:hypothetical protein